MSKKYGESLENCRLGNASDPNETIGARPALTKENTSLSFHPIVFPLYYLYMLYANYIYKL